MKIFDDIYHWDVIAICDDECYVCLSRHKIRVWKNYDVQIANIDDDAIFANELIVFDHNAINHEHEIIEKNWINWSFHFVFSMQIIERLVH